MVLRLANAFGERQRIHSSQGVIAVFLGKVLRGEALDIWGDGSVIRDYIHVSDIVQAMIKSVTYTGPERVFNIGSGKGVSINEVIDGIEFVVGTKVSRNYHPSRVFDVPANVLCINRALEALDWYPKVMFKDGLSRMVDWIRGIAVERI